MDLVAENAALRARVVALEAEVAALKARLGEAVEVTETLAEEKAELAVLAGLPNQAEAVEEARARFAPLGDAGGGPTWVRSPLVELESPVLLGSTRYLLGFDYAVVDGDREPRFRAVLRTLMNPTDRLKHAESVTLVLDGGASEAVELPVLTHTVLERLGGRSSRRKAASSRGAFNEELLLEVSADDLERVARMQDGVLRVSSVEARLSREHAALARAALLRAERGSLEE